MAVDISEAKKRALIDEFGALDKKLDGLKPDIKRHKELRDEIAGWFDTADAEKSHTAEGKLYTVEVSPKAEERVVLSMAKLAKRLGAKFMSLVKLPAKALDQHLSPEEQTKYVVKRRTGARRVTATPKKEAA